jgi:hypothetical protein
MVEVIIMFGKLFEKIKRFDEGFSYVVDFNALIDYLEKEAMECIMQIPDVNDAEWSIFIYYNDEKYLMDISTNSNRELIIKLDEQEIHGIKEFKANARIGGRMLHSIEYFRVVFPAFDSTVLNKYKKEHPEIQ